MPLLRTALAFLSASLLTFPMEIRGQVERWALIPELRYLPSDAAPLTSIWQIAVNDKREAFVLDGSDVALHVFDADGRYLRSIGQRGGGPGEYRAPVRIGWLGDTLWVADRVLRRITLFDQYGELIRVISPLDVPLSGSSAGFNIRALLADGSVLLQGKLPRSALPLIEAQGHLHLRVSPEGVVLDTLRWLSFRNALMVVQIPGYGILQMWQPWSHSDLLTISRIGERIVVVERPVITDDTVGQYRVVALNPSGRVQYMRTVSVRPVRLSDSRVDDWAKDYVERSELGKYFPNAAAARRALTETAYRPEYLPAVPNALTLSSEVRVHAGNDGSVWVQREIGNAEEQRWDVFDREGNFVATATLPGKTTLHEVSASTIWAVELDEFDVPTIVRYRVERNRR